jgi:hypothetical protein
MTHQILQELTLPNLSQTLFHTLGCSDEEDVFLKRMEGSLISSEMQIHRLYAILSCLAEEDHYSMMEVIDNVGLLKKLRFYLHGLGSRAIGWNLDDFTIKEIIELIQMALSINRLDHELA